MSVIRQVGKNVLTQWVAFGINGVIGILLVPFLIATLGKDLFGIAALMGVIVTFAMIADLGLQSALGRHLADALAKNDHQRYLQFANTAFFFWASLALVVALSLFHFSESIVAFLGVGPPLFDTAVLLLKTFGIASLFLAFIQPVFSAIISSHNRFDLISRTEALASLFNGCALFLFLGPFNGGIFAWALIMLTTRILVVVIFAGTSLKRASWIRFSPLYFRSEALKELFSFGWQVFFLKLAGLLSVKADPIIISKFVGPAALALYRPALVLTGKFQPLVMVLANQLLPVTARYNATENTEALGKVLFLGTRVTFILAIGAFVLLGGFSQSITRIWLEGSLGSDYRVAGYILLGWAIIHLIQGSGGSVWPILLAKNKIRLWVYLQIPVSVLNIAGSVYLVRNTDLGIVGVVIPTIFAGLFIRFVTFFYICKVLNLRPGHYFNEAYSRPVIILILFAGVVLMLEILFPAQSFLGLIWITGLSGIVWGLLAFSVGFRREEIQMIYGKLGISKKLKKTLSTSSKTF